MLGPITDKRIECSKETHEKGDRPAIVRVSDNSVFEVQNQKMVKKLVGEFVAVSGKVKEKNARIKVVSGRGSGPSRDPEKRDRRPTHGRAQLPIQRGPRVREDSALPWP